MLNLSVWKIVTYRTVPVAGKHLVMGTTGVEIKPELSRYERCTFFTTLLSEYGLRKLTAHAELTKKEQSKLKSKFFVSSQPIIFNTTLHISPVQSVFRVCVRYVCSFTGL